MSLGYILTITDANGSVIELASKEGDSQNYDILSASFKSNTLDDNAKSRANNVRAEIKVIGKITEYNYKITNELANWANARNDELQYRTIELKIYSTTTGSKLLRRYEIKEMFILDYDEIFDHERSGNSEFANIEADNTSGLFILHAVQRIGQYDLYVESE